MASEALLTCRSTGSPDRQYLGMCRRVFQFSGSVPLCSDHPPPRRNHDRADRNLSARASGAGGVKRDVHKAAKPAHRRCPIL